MGQSSASHVVMEVDATGSSADGGSTLKATASALKMKKQPSGDQAVVAMDDDTVASEKCRLLEEGEASGKRVDGVDQNAGQKDGAAKTSYVAPQTVVFWLSMWFVQNIGVTFWNKKALNTIRLPVTLTFVHMVCNTIGALLYIYAYRGIERKPLKAGQQSLMVYFSLIFVSNIITGNWSLGLVSITFNQVMRALVPSVVVGLSMMILGKTYTRERKLCLIPVACGVYLACQGDKSCTFLGLLITIAAVIFAGLKVVLSNKFLSGDLKLHPVDLILHQAPLSAMWCLMAMFMSGEWAILMKHWDQLPALSTWYLITGVVSFLLNVTSFYANKVTSPVTLCVCGNMKQILVITLSIVINHDVITAQKLLGIFVVTVGGIAYAYISNKEMNRASVPIRPQRA
ncbi:Drug/metabolite transporter, partial [Globisporangium splendens]